MKEIEIPFGAKDSELKGWEYTIPEGMEAEIKDGKIVVREKKPKLTEFEEMLYAIFDAYNGLQIDVGAAVVTNAKTLLELAKKEICKGCTVSIDSYIKGRDDAKKEYEKPYTYYYPIFHQPCHHGGICTNPMRDCINCPMQSNDTTTNTTSGTCKKDQL